MVQDSFVNYIRKFRFSFCAHSVATFNHMIALFQNNPGTKLLCGYFRSAFAGISSASSGISPCWDRMNNAPASYKYNFSKELIVFRPSCVFSRPIFIPSRFPYKQLLITGSPHITHLQQLNFS